MIALAMSPRLRMQNRNAEPERRQVCRPPAEESDSGIFQSFKSGNLSAGYRATNRPAPGRCLESMVLLQYRRLLLLRCYF